MYFCVGVSQLCAYWNESGRGSPVRQLTKFARGLTKIKTVTSVNEIESSDAAPAEQLPKIGAPSAVQLSFVSSSAPNE
jgi:hypothetical protein